MLNSEIIEHNHLILKKQIDECNANLLVDKRRLTKLNVRFVFLVERERAWI